MFSTVYGSRGISVHDKVFNDLDRRNNKIDKLRTSLNDQYSKAISKPMKYSVLSSTSSRFSNVDSSYKTKKEPSFNRFSQIHPNDTSLLSRYGPNTGSSPYSLRTSYRTLEKDQEEKKSSNKTGLYRPLSIAKSKTTSTSRTNKYDNFSDDEESITNEILRLHDQIQDSVTKHRKIIIDENSEEEHSTEESYVPPQITEIILKNNEVPKPDFKELPQLSLRQKLEEKEELKKKWEAENHFDKIDLDQTSGEAASSEFSTEMEEMAAAITKPADAKDYDKLTPAQKVLEDAKRSLEKMRKPASERVPTAREELIRKAREEAQRIKARKEKLAQNHDNNVDKNKAEDIENIQKEQQPSRNYYANQDYPNKENDLSSQKPISNESQRNDQRKEENVRKTFFDRSIDEAKGKINSQETRKISESRKKEDPSQNYRSRKYIESQFSTPNSNLKDSDSDLQNSLTPSPQPSNHNRRQLKTSPSDQINISPQTQKIPTKNQATVRDQNLYPNYHDQPKNNFISQPDSPSPLQKETAVSPQNQRDYSKNKSSVSPQENNLPHKEQISEEERRKAIFEKSIEEARKARRNQSEALNHNNLSPPKEEIDENLWANDKHEEKKTEKENIRVSPYQQRIASITARLFPEEPHNIISTQSLVEIDPIPKQKQSQKPKLTISSSSLAICKTAPDTPTARKDSSDDSEVPPDFASMTKGQIARLLAKKMSEEAGRGTDILPVSFDDPNSLGLSSSALTTEEDTGTMEEVLPPKMNNDDDDDDFEQIEKKIYENGTLSDSSSIFANSPVPQPILSKPSSKPLCDDKIDKKVTLITDHPVENEGIKENSSDMIFASAGADMSDIPKQPMPLTKEEREKMNKERLEGDEDLLGELMKLADDIEEEEDNVEDFQPSPLSVSTESPVYIPETIDSSSSSSLEEEDEEDENPRGDKQQLFDFISDPSYEEDDLSDEPSLGPQQETKREEDVLRSESDSLCSEEDSIGDLEEEDIPPFHVVKEDSLDGEQYKDEDSYARFEDARDRALRSVRLPDARKSAIIGLFGAADELLKVQLAASVC